MHAGVKAGAWTLICLCSAFRKFDSNVCIKYVFRSIGMKENFSTIESVDYKAKTHKNQPDPSVLGLSATSINSTATFQCMVLDTL